MGRENNISAHCFFVWRELSCVWLSMSNLLFVLLYVHQETLSPFLLWLAWHQHVHDETGVNLTWVMRLGWRRAARAVAHSPAGKLASSDTADIALLLLFCSSPLCFLTNPVKVRFVHVSAEWEVMLTFEYSTKKKKIIGFYFFIWNCTVRQYMCSSKCAGWMGNYEKCRRVAVYKIKVIV